MIKYIINLLIFCVVLFLYIHIHYHLKCSNDLEVYTIEQPSKDKLEEICDLRQPVIFEYNNQLLESCNLSTLDDNYGCFDINIRDTTNIDENSEMYLPLAFKECMNIFLNDKDSKYISENNEEFLNESGVIKDYKYNDAFLRPSLLFKRMYDFNTGSVGSMTPLRYELNYRNYFYVTSGEIKMKLIPPSYSKYLYPIKDYDNFEFRSPINIWQIQSQYRNNIDKIKEMEVILHEGDIIYIPAYWWYSIKYEKMSCVCSFKYRTIMNFLAISPRLALHQLQNQNIKRKVVQKIDIKVNKSNKNNNDNDNDNIDNEINEINENNKLK